jgi:PIN domain nuclease of toxin-antitoxin system
MDVGSWLATVAEIEAVRFMPVDVEIMLKSVELPGEFHKSPADRIIVATARKLAAPLVTKDEKIRAYAHVKTVW